MSSSELPRRQRLLLIGGGHAHVQVIKALRARPQHVEVVLIDSQQSASYSGMVPGCIAGMYNAQETLIRLPPLAEASRIEFVHGAVTDLCLSEKRVTYQLVSPVGTAESKSACPSDASVASNQHGVSRSLSFDVVSIDIGSSSRDWDLVPGAKLYSIPTRPITRLVERLDEARTRLLNDDNRTASPQDDTKAVPNVVVVGGGAAGLELAFAVMARWRPDFPGATCTIINAGPKLLTSGEVGISTTSPQQEELLHQVLAEKRIEVFNSCFVQEVAADYVEVVGVSDSVVRRIPATHCIWAAGAGPARLARTLLEQRKAKKHESHYRDADRRSSTILDMTDDGWIEVGATLQSTSHPFVFAAGDCASICLDDREESGCASVAPKAGVYAVRAGPILIDNLTRYLDRLGLEAAPNSESKVTEPDTLSLVRYQPQDDFLKLIVCDREEAIGFRFGLALRGRWVWKLKDRIDQTFMNLFRVGISASSVGVTDKGNGHGSSKYDTSQYDSSIDADPTLVAPMPDEAAVLLRRQDEDVDFLLAWKVLRRMSNDREYRGAVLSRCNVQVEIEVT